MVAFGCVGTGGFVVIKDDVEESALFKFCAGANAGDVMGSGSVTCLIPPKKT